MDSSVSLSTLPADSSLEARQPASQPGDAFGLLLTAPGEGSTSAAPSGSSGHPCSIRGDQESSPQSAWGRGGASGRGTLRDC